MCMWALLPCISLMLWRGAVSWAFSSLAFVLIEPRGMLATGCEAALCSWDRLTVSTAGVLWPGMAASKIATAKIAPTTIPAWTNRLTAELRTDINVLLQLLLNARWRSSTTFDATHQFMFPFYDT